MKATKTKIFTVDLVSGIFTTTISISIEPIQLSDRTYLRKLLIRGW